MQTQDQGFTVDHPIVGQNTGTWERNVFKINEPGEAVQNNGLNKLGGLTSSAFKRLSTVSAGVYIDEDLSVIRDPQKNGYGSINYRITNRYKCVDALDYCPQRPTFYDLYYMLQKSSPNTAVVRIARWSGPIEGFEVDPDVIGGVTFTAPAGENIVSGCLVRAQGLTNYGGMAILCTVTGASGANTIRLYFCNPSSATLITQVDSTLFDIAPHCNAWLNGPRVIVQSPIFDANGPQYAWSTTTPTTAASWAQLAYSAWLVADFSSATATLNLFGTERTTAGRAQVGANITITSAGVLTETALVPEVGYAQGANAFNGPGFYTSLFTDTAGGASIQAMSGNQSFNVNTQATGAGITETVLPDAVGYIPILQGANPTWYLKIKAANKQPAILAFADSVLDPGSVISEFGGFDMTYCPSVGRGNNNTTSGLIVYALGNGRFDAVEYEWGDGIATNSPLNSDSRIEYNVFQMAKGSALNILDMNRAVIDLNYGSFVRCGVAYQTQFSTGVGANTINIQPGNKYTNGVYLGAFVGVASTALPNRVDWLEYYPSILAYHSAYTNGAAREYVPGNETGSSIVESQLKFIDTAYSDRQTFSFVQNDYLPIPACCRIQDGVVTLPTGIALQGQSVSDSDGSAVGYSGYILTAFLPTDLQPFVIQGQLYGTDDRDFYAIENTPSALNAPEKILRADKYVFLTTTKDGAYFYNSNDATIALFDGGRSFEPILNLAGLIGTYTASAAGSIVVPTQKGYGESVWQKVALYNQSTDSLFIRLSGATGSNYYWMRLSKMGPTIHLLATNEDVGIKDRAGGQVFMTSSGNAANNTFYYANLFTNTSELVGDTVRPFAYQSPYYGIEEGNYVRVLKYIFMLKVTAPTTTDLVVTFKWFTYDSSGTETYTFLQNTYTANNGYVYLEYIPTQQVGHGVSIGLSSTKEVYILGITGHYGQPELALSVNQNPSTS